jgi:hypothetical protein
MQVLRGTKKIPSSGGLDRTAPDALMVMEYVRLNEEPSAA